jgi:hypothetical protein
MQLYSALPGWTSFATSFASRCRQVLADARAAQVHGAHVRDVEHARVAAHRVVLLELGAVVERHVPAAEVDHARAEFDVSRVERSPECHGSPDRGPKTKKRRTGVSLFAPLSLDLRDRARF